MGRNLDAPHQASLAPLETSALFRGDVNPENTPPTTYRFEYGETESYGERLPDIGIGASTNPVPVAFVQLMRHGPGELRPLSEPANQFSPLKGSPQPAPTVRALGFGLMSLPFT